MNEQIQFLKELQATMKHEDEHDYDNQASPRFWAIMDYKTVPGHEDYHTGENQYFFNDGDHIVFSNFKDLKEFVEERYEDEIDNDEELRELLNSEDEENDNLYDLWEYVDDNLNSDGYFNKVFVTEEEFIVPSTMFLTKEEAKRHLELNHYHYTSKAHTYAMTAWRAPKVEKLLDIVMNFDWDSIAIKEKV